MKVRNIVYEKSVKIEKESKCSSVFQIQSFKHDKQISFDQSNEDSSNFLKESDIINTEKDFLFLNQETQ